MRHQSGAVQPVLGHATVLCSISSEAAVSARAAVGVNGIWFDARDGYQHADIEGSLNAKASLQPHISLVGSGAYGFRGSYYRYAAGVRITATDARDRDFNVGIGFQYRGSGSETLKPDEWAPDASIGWRPWPAVLPGIILGAQGWYGIDSKVGGVLAGARLAFPY